MILQRRILNLFTRFVKPSISQYQNLQQLQAEIRHKLLLEVEQLNQNKLANNRFFNKEKIVAKVLNLNQKMSLPIAQKTFKFNAFTQNGKKQFQIEQNVANNNRNYPFLLQQIDYGLPVLSQIPNHFSYKRGVSKLQEYKNDKNIAYVFNLPVDVTKGEILQKIGFQSIKKIQIKYCLLGLPAYAQITFNTEDAVSNIVLHNRSSFMLRQKLCQFKTHFDHQKNKIVNRKLIIKGVQPSQNDLLLNLSKYGRVLEFDFPTIIKRNPSVQEVKKFYSGTDNLIKINLHKLNGQIQSEYFPTLEQSPRFNPMLQFQGNLQQKRKAQEQRYKHRMRFAQNIDVYEGQQNKISIKNMGYCIVTFSSFEQAQNCYFNTRYHYKVDLLKDKQQFQVDQQYKKKVLRFIDNEYMKTELLKEKTVQQKQFQEQYKNYTLFDKLTNLQIYQDAMKQEFCDEDYQAEAQRLEAYYKKMTKHIKQSIGKKLGSKSFDQIAQLQLFGKILPKKDKSPKIKIQTIIDKDQKEEYFNSLQKLQPFTSRHVTYRDQQYTQKKNKRPLKGDQIKPEAQEFPIQDVETPEVAAQGSQPVGEVEDLQGKRNFSTQKHIQTLFRQRTIVQQANYLLRYNEFIRDTINEYLGIFGQERLMPKLQESKTYLCPQKITFSDGSDFLTEQDLQKISQYHINPEQAKEQFQSYFKQNQILKSNNINFRQLTKMSREQQWFLNQKLQDVGVVKQVYELDDQKNIEKKLNYLNSTVAGFGQQFRIHEEKNGTKSIIRIAKTDNIYPIDKIGILNELTKKTQIKNQSVLRNLYKKYQKEIFKTGQFPQQVRQAFEIPQGKSLDDMFEQFGAKYGVYKKDFQSLINLKNFSRSQIQEDIANQIQMQKIRQQQKETKPSDFAKDPNNIEVKDREGFFKVSKFRQI